MSTRYVERLAEERDSLAAQILSLAEKAANENRSLSEDENTAATNMRGKVDSLDKEIRTWASTSDAFSKFASISQPGSEKREQAKNENTSRTIGEQFVSSNEFRSYQGGGQGQKLYVPSSLWETRALITTDTLNLAPADWVAKAPTLTSPLLDAIGRVKTNRDVVKISIPSSTGPVAGGPIAEGAPKPEATITWTDANVDIGTYAHWVPVTRQALADAPYLRSVIEGSLTNGVLRKFESEAAVTVNAATGFLPASGVSLPEGIRNGIGLVEGAGFQAQAILMNPQDSADVDNAAGAESALVAYAQRQRTLWGVPIITAGAVPVGTAYVGDLKNGVTWFDREESAVYLTDSHADYFISNKLVVLAEGRAGFAVTAPSAIAEVTVTP